MRRRWWMTRWSIQSSDIPLYWWRMSSCTTGQDQPLVWTCWSSRQSGCWRPFRAALPLSSRPGFPPQLAARCPSDQLDRPLSSTAGQKAVQLKVDLTNLEKAVLGKVRVRLNRSMGNRRKGPLCCPAEANRRLLGNLQIDSMSLPHRSDAPGACLSKEGSCCAAPQTFCPSTSITWWASTGSTSSRGSSGSSLSTTVGHPGTLSRLVGTSVRHFYSHTTTAVIQIAVVFICSAQHGGIRCKDITSRLPIAPFFIFEKGLASNLAPCHRTIGDFSGIFGDWRERMYCSSVVPVWASAATSATKSSKEVTDVL